MKSNDNHQEVEFPLDPADREAGAANISGHRTGCQMSAAGVIAYDGEWGPSLIEMEGETVDDES